MQKIPTLAECIASEANSGWLSLFLLTTDLALVASDTPVSRQNRFNVRFALQRIFTPVKPISNKVIL